MEYRIPLDVISGAKTASARALLAYANKVLTTLTSTAYAHDRDLVWDEEAGVYHTDCSGYLNKLLRERAPDLFDALATAQKKTRPSAGDYYNFFRGITLGERRGGWRRLGLITDMRPGDVLVWKHNSIPLNGSTGHVVLVCSEVAKYAEREGAWKVRVTDAASSGHSDDSRPAGTSGVGIGEIGLRASAIDPVGAYAWTLRGPWRTDCRITAGRPVL